MSEHDEALAALRDFVTRDHKWRPLPTGGAYLVYIRAFADGSVDTFAVKDATDTHVERTDRRGLIVWRVTNLTVFEAIAELRKLPAPGAVGAPTEPLSDGNPHAPRKNDGRARP